MLSYFRSNDFCKISQVIRQALSIICLIAIVFFSISQSYAYGPPDYVPNDAHPRIYLTSDRLSELRASAAANSEEWVTLRDWCAAHLNDTGWQNTKDTRWKAGYRMSAFGSHMLNYSMAYQILKVSNPSLANIYGQHALDIMMATIANFSTGEELNGLVMIRQGEVSDVTINAAEQIAGLPSNPGILKGNYKNGYASRSICVAMALSYDWLYDLMRPSDKIIASNMMMRWIDWIRGVRSQYNNGVLIEGVRYYEDQDISGDATHINTTVSSEALKAYGISGVGNNFFSGHFQLSMLAALAIYGDNTDAPTYLSYVRNTLWEKTVKPEITNKLGSKGGDSVEGWNYASGWFRDLEAIYAYKYATGENLFTGLDWPTELVKCYISVTNSDLTNILNYGEITGNNGKAQPYEELILSPNYIVNKEYPNDDTYKFGQYYLNHAKFSNLAEEWKRFLFLNSGAEEKPLASMPLYYHSIGSGLVTMRSTWVNAPETLFAAVQLGGKMDPGVSHETYGQGNIFLHRGSDVLLAHQNMQRDSVSHNTIVFNNTNHHAMNPPLASTAIDRLEHAPGYTFVRADITNAWKRTWKADGSKLFMRNMLQIGNKFAIVYDVTRSNTALGNLKEWVTNYVSEPFANDNNKTISATVGNSKIYNKTIYPISGTFTKSNPASGYWRMKYAPATLQEYDQFLHVIEATGSFSLQTPVAAIGSSNMRGAHIQESAKNTVVMFPVDQTGADVSGAISYSYTPTSTTTDHYIANVVPAQGYSVTVTGTTTKTITLTPVSPDVSKVQASDKGLLVVTVYNDNSYSQVNTSAKGNVVPATYLRGRVL